MQSVIWGHIVIWVSDPRSEGPINIGEI
jgi:hypothetical protein